MAMVLGFYRVTCSCCASRVLRRHARKGMNGGNAYVCTSCYARWEQTGRKCTACDAPVRGLQDVGLFVDRKALGHADCGGVRVLWG